MREILLALQRNHISIGSQLLLVVETVFVFITVIASLLTPRVIEARLEYAERISGRLSRRKGTVVIIAFVLMLLFRMTSSLLGISREPEVHDEFSYLLGADTFAAGRLTNPTHAFWRHFESIHIIQRPTYSSMYPPGQALMLALGTLVGGRPVVGVWLGMALMAGSISWMLQGWFPPKWALFGTGLMLVRFGVFNYWGSTYWGGAVAAAGGALVLGALPRLMRYRRLRHSLILGAGVAILANSRPYEGLILAIPVFITLLVWSVREELPPWSVAGFRLAAPFTLVVLCSGALMGYYFWRVTGNPFRMPYQVDQDTYSMTNPFFWQPLRTSPGYTHPAMRDYYLKWEMGAYVRLRTVHSRLKEIAAKGRDLWVFFVGPALTVPFLMLPWFYKDRRIRLLLIICCFTSAGLAPIFWLTFPHYAAPITAGVVALLVQGARHLSVVHAVGRPVGRQILRAVMVVGVLVTLTRATVPASLVSTTSTSWCCVGPGNVARAQLEDRLSQTGRRHLVIVRYGPDHQVQNEWVYNKADIDSAAVVWAREMGTVEDRALVEYFHGRQVWLLEPDQVPYRLSPYAAPTEVHSSMNIPRKAH